MSRLAEITFLADRFLHRFRSQMRDRIQVNGLPISAPDVKILLTINQFPEIAISELVRELGRDKSQITRKVKELEAKDLVTRTAADHDARVSILSLTSQGSEVVGQLRQEIEVVLQEILAPMPESDRETLKSLLKTASGSDGLD